MASKTQDAPKVVKKATSEKATPKVPTSATPAATGPQMKPVFAATYAGALLAIAAFMSPVSQLNLFPVYGSIGSAVHHQNGMTFTVVLAYMAKVALRKQGVDVDAKNWIAPLAYYTLPLQWILFQQSSRLGPVYGPLITEILTFFPVLFLTCITAFVLLENINVGAVPKAIFAFGAFTVMEQGATAFIPQILGKSDFFSRSGLQLLSATVAGLVTRSSMLAFAIPAVLHTLFSNPHYYGAKQTLLLNSTLGQYDYVLLDRADSNSGYISVLESRKDGFRVLRCDHSLLGGEWLLTDARKVMGYEDEETIYGVFTMLENVRIMKTEVFTPDDEKDALFIGLGAGTAPKAFIQHGLNVTVVELDPMVHEYAMKWFNFPEDHTAVIGDAVEWAAKYSKEKPESFDYIVHDVFTGGAEPTSLFTLEFLQNLSTLLKEDGAIAINFAGDFTQAPTRIVFNTILRVFPTCRAYRDTPPYEEETFLNMVVFCTKLNTKIEWRQATNDDYLGSMARRQFMPPDQDYELKLPSLIGDKKYQPWDILTTSNETLFDEFRLEHGLRHWKIMRTVLPAPIWENW